MKEEAAQSAKKEPESPVKEKQKDGSIIIVIATDVSFPSLVLKAILTGLGSFTSHPAEKTSNP